MKKRLDRISILLLLVLFISFYFIADYLLDKRDVDSDKKVISSESNSIVNNNYDKEKAIVNNLYSDVRILYDVINNKFKVSQDDTILIGDITYKKIINFDEIMNSVFTENGIKKYISDLDNYFAYTEDGYYLAGNLVTYQTYYFRGDKTQIFITDVSDTMINAIIYETWSSNNKNTLATFKVILENGNWLVDDVSILATE